MKKPEVLIENWTICTNVTPYRAPELLSIWLTGEAIGHPYFIDGHTITTSKLIDSNKSLSAGDRVETANSFYRLGTRLEETS